MSTYRVAGIDDKVAWKVRASLQSSDFDAPAYVDVAAHAGPCRVCLEPFEVGVERSVLFTYDPFREHDTSPLPGPVHIHELGCLPVTADSRVPAGLAEFSLTLTGYAAGGEVVVVERPAGPAEVEAAIARLFARPAVGYAHVRDADSGCFVCELGRPE
jgi:hypothetical protein